MENKNFNESKNIIEEVYIGSIAEELGIEPGDILKSVNGEKVRDIIDYKYLITDDYVTVNIEKTDGELWELEIEKDYDEDIGIAFTNPLIDKAKSCRNKCLFCFIDQLPKGMRNTLYFKDDDSRLSFLQGNFITLTNLSDDEIDRIIKYRLSPINISVHTTEPELRKKMLNNKNAGKIYSIIKRFSKAGIEMNCQIVLVPGINDGMHLGKTIRDLFELHPNVASVAIVPVGVTKFREGLQELSTFDKYSANEVIKSIHELQNEFLKGADTRFAFPSDEFYILSDREIPSYNSYEGFSQLENGVGLLRLFYSEVIDALDMMNAPTELNKEYYLATGELAANFMQEVVEKIQHKIKGLRVNVVTIKNNFFGEKITVSGLITGTDIVEQLKGKNLKDGLIIPTSMLRRDDNVFLDDMTTDDVSKELKTEIIVSKVDGKDFVKIFEKGMR